MLVQIPITLACGDYDRTRAIKDGRVPVEGCAVTYLPMEPEEVFHRAFKHQEFDVCELSFSSYLRTVDAGTSPYVGIPAFVSRLFPNYREVEKAYYRKTGMFPMMHLVGVKRELVERHPWLPASLYKAFVQAKAFAMREVHDVNALAVTLPWLVAEAEETAQLVGQDFWRYGVDEDAKEIDALTRYAHEQGLVTRKMPVEALFPQSGIEVSKV